MSQATATQASATQASATQVSGRQVSGRQAGNPARRYVRRLGAGDLLVLALIVLELGAGLAAALQGERTAGVAIAVVGPLLTFVIYRNFILMVSLLGLIGEVRAELHESPIRHSRRRLPAPNRSAGREAAA